jgi:archaeosortase A (PGF-CTERM-specific)
MIGYELLLTGVTFLLTAAAILYKVTSYEEVARGVAGGAFISMTVLWGALAVWYQFFKNGSGGEYTFVVIISAIATGLSLQATWLILSGWEREKQATVAAAVTLFIATPTEVFPSVKYGIQEMVAKQTVVIMEWLSYNPQIVAKPGSENIQNTIFLESYYTLTVASECTGVATIAIFAGLIASTDTHLKYKSILILSTPVIVHAINLTRLVFVGVAMSDGIFMSLLPIDQHMNYIIAEVAIGQTYTVIVALVAFVWLSRFMPSMRYLVEDLTTVPSIQK